MVKKLKPNVLIRQKVPDCFSKLQGVEELRGGAPIWTGLNVGITKRDVIFFFFSSLFLDRLRRGVQVVCVNGTLRAQLRSLQRNEKE